MVSQSAPLRAALLLLLLMMASLAAAQSEEGWLAQQFRRNDSGIAGPPPPGAPTALAQALATWDWLRRPPRSATDQLPLSEVATFLAANPDFPGLSDARRRAEAQAADPALTPDSSARAWFTAIPPETTAGRARLALLLQASAPREAPALARAAWTGGAMPEPLETALLAAFGNVLTSQDHAARADALLWAGQLSAARRLLPLLAEDARILTEARLALRTNAPDAEARAASVPSRFRGQAGLLYDRSLWLERNRGLAAAEALLAGSDVTPGSVTAPRTWLQRRLTLARAAWRRGDPRLAERILASHGTLAAGTDTAGLPLGVRVDLSDTEWLAGFLALRKNGRPEAAAEHFTRFLTVVQTPISRSRGDYWLGRAEKARGRTREAEAAFTRAARFYDYFYGQLATEELGRLPELPLVNRPRPSAAEVKAVESLPLARAMVLLGRMNEPQRQSPFVRALATAVKTPVDRRAAAELGARIGRPDLGVWAWREGRNPDDEGILDLAYPRLPATSPVEPRLWTYAHAITRQESSFDRTAISSAGARGLMQLMPGTAGDVAKSLGLPYSLDRLTADPAYNVQLGSTYLGRRRESLGNWMLAAAAYNAGIGNARKWIAMNGDPRLPASAGGVDPIDWIESIPIQETRTYVQRVTENAVVYSLLEPARPGASPRASAWIR